MSEIIVTNVEPGETLSGLAARYGVSVDALQRWNRIENPDLVLVGQRIVVYNAADAVGLPVSESSKLRTKFDSLMADGSHDIVVGGAIILGIFLLLLLLRRKRREATSISHFSSHKQSQTVSFREALNAGVQTNTLHDSRPAPAADPPLRPQVNDGERLVSTELRQRYYDWILIDNKMLPSYQGTTQIDHILISPRAVFLIETKDMNGWVFGSPGNKQWTQSYAIGYWSKKADTKSKKFKFHNPLWQNKGHAKSLVRLRIVDPHILRPIVIFVGDSEMKTADKVLPFDEHEKIARQKKTWRMRGVICMSLVELNRYIDFSISASSNSNLSRRKMEAIRDRIRKREIPMTAESYAQHVDFVGAVRELSSR